MKNPSTAVDPIATLRWHYGHPREAALAQHRSGVPVIGVTSNTVPWEIIRAAGAFPVLISAVHENTPLSDPFMEPVFDRRIRSIFEDLLAGRWPFLRALIIPRTSEWEHKLYLYLLEVRRQSPRRRRLPEPRLFDLLHTRSANAARHGLARTRELAHALAELTGRRIGARGLQQAIRESNQARDGVRRLLALCRGPKARLAGSEALALVGAWHFMDRRDYAGHAHRAAALIGARPALRGPRVLVKGSPLDHPGLHEAIEAAGGVVVAEDDWFGSRSAGRDIAGSDPLTAIFRKYYLDAPSPRVFPSAVADAWFEREIARGIDGVVYYLPPDDDVLGWDYPQHKQVLDERRIPVALIRDDARHLSDQSRERINQFVHDLCARGTVR